MSEEKIAIPVGKEKVNSLLCDLLGIDRDRNPNLAPTAVEISIKSGEYPTVNVTYRIFPTKETFPDWSARWEQYTYQLQLIRKVGTDEAGETKWEEVSKEI